MGALELYDYIREHFSYNSETGEITRDDRKNSNGSLDKDGYIILKVKKHQFKAHRIAWFLYYGEFPEGEIDHINRIKTDNRIANLRIATRREQNLNKEIQPNPFTGCVGIYKDTTTQGLRAKYTTRLKGKAYRFRTLNEATQFRIKNKLTV